MNIGELIQSLLSNNVTINAASGYALTATSSSGFAGVEGVGYAGVLGSGTAYGVYGSASGNIGVYGDGTYGLFGQGTGSGNYGVYGSGNYGVYGSGSTAGVSGYTSTTASSGVLGQDTSTGIGGYAVQGVSTNGLGVTGTGPIGVYGVAASGGIGVYGWQTSSSGYAVYANGNLHVTGAITAPSVLKDDRVVSLYAVHSPENWYEDFGSGRLEDGVATIKLDATFAQTVNTEAEYHVFMTPKGDCKGLYVTNEAATGFEVRELGSGQSSVAFDYRIVAKRKGLEGLRLEVVSTDHEQAEAMRKNLAERPSHTPRPQHPPKPPQPPQQPAVPEPPK